MRASPLIVGQKNSIENSVEDKVTNHNLLNGQNVLIVSSGPIEASVIVQMLENAGAKASIVLSIAEAKNELRKNKNQSVIINETMLDDTRQPFKKPGPASQGHRVAPAIST